VISKIAVMYYTEMGPAEKKFSVQFFLKCEKCGPKWILQGKKIAAQKIWLVTFSFQGGDLLPLLAKLAYTNIYAPHPMATTTTAIPLVFLRSCAIQSATSLFDLLA
jgi:hypothetical protein